MAAVDHLQNPDTNYKRAVLEFLTESISSIQVVPAVQLQIAMTGESVECAVITNNHSPARASTVTAVPPPQ